MALQMAALEAGQFRKMKLTAGHRGLPLILESNRPIAAAVIYRNPWGESVSTMPELLEMSIITKQTSAMVIANYSIRQ